MDFSNVAKYLDQIDKNLIPECEVVVYKNNERLFYHSSSVNAKMNGGTDMYYLFSASKVITVTAALMLVEKEKIFLDDPVSKYLPEFAELYVKKNGSIVPAEKTLTVRHLFSMSGGFTYDLGFEGIKKVNEQKNNQATTREIVAAMSKMPLIFEPGEDYNYSLCHDILAAVVEVASGMSFYEFLKKNIFEPLGMNNTTFRINDDIKKRMAKQYRVDSSFCAREVEPACAYCLSDKYESGGAGLISCLNDYALFADALASGKSKDGYTLLQPKTVALFNTPQLSEKGQKTYEIAHRLGYRYTLGVRSLYDKQKAKSLSPVGEFGWDGAAGAYVMIDTTNKVSVYYAQHVLGCGYVYNTVHLGLRNQVYKSLGIE